jgi:arabinogalactan endo-1,4-beta-galactosidase
MLHLHGGGQHGLPGYFFDRFTRHSSQFDCIGLSFYPTWGDDLQALKKNLHALAARFGKPIYVVETSYPWRETPPAMTNPAAMHWPRTPEGQTQFLRDLDATLASVPGGLGAGFFWWYPEAVPVQDRFIWRGGSEALFDETGRPLPALLEFGRLGR